MKTIYNTWRADVRSYMKRSTLEEYAFLSYTEAHDKEKKVHQAHMFLVSGCNWLLRQFLRFPLVYGSTHTETRTGARCGWGHLLRAFEEHKGSKQYRNAVENSQRKGQDHVRLSQQIRGARHYHEQGKIISFKVRNRVIDFSELPESEQELSQDYEAGRSWAKTNALLQQQEERGTTNFHLLHMTS